MKFREILGTSNGTQNLEMYHYCIGATSRESVKSGDDWTEVTHYRGTVAVGRIITDLCNGKTQYYVREG